MSDSYCGWFGDYPHVEPGNKILASHNKLDNIASI